MPENRPRGHADRRRGQPAPPVVTLSREVGWAVATPIIPAYVPGVISKNPSSIPRKSWRIWHLSTVWRN